MSRNACSRLAFLYFICSTRMGWLFLVTGCSFRHITKRTVQDGLPCHVCGWWPWPGRNTKTCSWIAGETGGPFLCHRGTRTETRTFHRTRLRRSSLVTDRSLVFATAGHYCGMFRAEESEFCLCLKGPPARPAPPPAPCHTRFVERPVCGQDGSPEGPAAIGEV